MRTGASVVFSEAMIFDYRNDEWKFQPTGPLTGGASDAVAFRNTRTTSPSRWAVTCGSPRSTC